MTNVDVAAEQATQAHLMLSIPIAKGSTKEDPMVIEINLREITDDAFPGVSYKEIMYQGLKAILNRGMTDIPSDKTEESIKGAREVAERNLKALREGTIRATGGKAKGVAGKVKTEALRLAKVVVKAELKALGIVLRHVDASEITDLAKAVLEARPELMQQAEANIAQTDKLSKPDEAMKSIISKVKVNQGKVAKEKAEKAKAKEQLSAAKAGIVAQRARGATQPTQH